MNRKLILMLAFGTMCVVAGAAQRRLEAAAGKCQDLAVAGGQCPTKSGDDPNISLCEDYNNAPQLCTSGPHPVTLRQPNTSSFTKSVGFYPELQTGTGYPPVPLTTTCYFRRICAYDSNKGICNGTDTERVIQDWYVTKACGP